MILLTIVTRHVFFQIAFGFEIFLAYFTSFLRMIHDRREMNFVYN